MSAAYVIITVITIVANAWATATDLVQPKWLLATMDEVGVPRSWLPSLAALKAAGAVGLLLGLLGLWPLGIAAAVGLVPFFAGALAATSAPRPSTRSRSPRPTSRWPSPPRSSPSPPADGSARRTAALNAGTWTWCRGRGRCH